MKTNKKYAKAESMELESMMADPKKRAMMKRMLSKFEDGGKVKSKMKGNQTSVGAQQQKGERVDQGLPVRPQDYDMTTPAGVAAYKADRTKSRENRLKIQSDMKDMTPAERNKMAAERGRAAQAKPVTGKSPDLYTIGGGQGVRVNRDVRAAASQTGAQSENLRPSTSSSTVSPRKRRPMNP